MTKFESSEHREGSEAPRTHLRLSALEKLGMRRLFLLRSEVQRLLELPSAPAAPIAHPVIPRFVRSPLTFQALEALLPHIDRVLESTRAKIHETTGRVTRARVRTELLEEGRLHRDALALELDETPFPRIDEDDARFEEMRDRTARTDRFLHLVVPPGDEVPGFEPGFAYTQCPLPASALARLRADAAIDPDRVSEELPFVPPYGARSSITDWYHDRLHCAQILGDIFDTGEALPTLDGRSTTRVIVAHGVHAGRDLEGQLLVTRRRPNENGLSAYLSNNADRVLRERLHVRDAQLDEVDEVAPWALDLRAHYTKLQHWNELPVPERDAEGTAILALLENIGEVLGTPQRETLQRVRRTIERLAIARAQGKTIAKNPGALMATVVGLPGLLRELEQIALSRATTVRREIDALDAYKRGFHRGRNHALKDVRALLTPEAHVPSLAAVRASLVAIRGHLAVPEGHPDIQPYAMMRRDVRELIERLLARLDAPTPVWWEQSRAEILGLYTLLKHSRLYELTEDLLGVLTLTQSPVKLPNPTTTPAQRIHAARQALDTFVTSSLDPDALKRVGIPSDRASLLLPETYAVRSGAREYLRAVSALAGAKTEAAQETCIERGLRALGGSTPWGDTLTKLGAHAPSTEGRMAILEGGLRAFDPLGNYERIARAVAHDLEHQEA